MGAEWQLVLMWDNIFKLIAALIGSAGAFLTWKRHDSSLKNDKEVQDREEAQDKVEEKSKGEELVKEVVELEGEERERVLNEIRKRIAE